MNTVRELIMELLKHPMDARPVVNLGRNEGANGKTAGKVEAVNAYRYKYKGTGPWQEDYYPYTHDPDEDREVVINIIGED